MRIVIADQQPSARSALGLLINTQPDMVLAGDAADVAELLVRIRQDDAELVVLDWDAFGEKVESLLELLDDPPLIVALSVDNQARSEVLSSGAVGFTHKGEPPTELLEVIRSSWKQSQISRKPK